MSKRIDVAVIDSQPLFQEGVCNALRLSEFIDVVGVGSGIDDAVEISRNQSPHVILLDFQLRGGGLNALRSVSKLGGGVRAIMLAVSPCERDLSDSFDSGAWGYVKKGVRGEQLVDVVNTVHGGEVYAEPTLAATMISGRGSKPKAKENPLSSITKREMDILKLVTQGKTNKEIARAHGLSEKTVKHYVTSILQKLSARNRVEAALIASRHIQP